MHWNEFKPPTDCRASSSGITLLASDESEASVHLYEFLLTRESWEQWSIGPGDYEFEVQGRFPSHAKAVPRFDLTIRYDANGAILRVSRRMPEPGLSGDPAIDVWDRTPRLVALQLPLEQHSHDIRLFFPNVGTHGGELWTSSSLLSNISPYYKDLLSSGFSESVTRHGKRPRLNAREPVRSDTTAASNEAEEPATADEMKFEDSEDEFDALVAEKAPQLLHYSYPSSDETPFRQLTITSHSWSTYRAVLGHVLSARLRYGPLRSLRGTPDLVTSYTDSLEALLAGKSGAEDVDKGKAKDKGEAPGDYSPPERLLPLPVSPKSVFRLAHFLQMDKLADHALVELSEQVHAPNIAAELFGNVAEKYDEVRKVVMDVAVANWREVSKSEGMQQVREKIRSGEMAAAAPTLMELLDQVAASVSE
ncbi:hypothetical protein JCM11251_006457 [Rhodosporidiobolus azoricus]